MCLMWAGLQRYDDVAQYGICGLSSPIVLPDIGPQAATQFLLVKRQSKTNQGGRPDYLACLPAQEESSDPPSALMLYLFYRFVCGHEEFPSPLDTDKWWVKGIRACTLQCCMTHDTCLPPLRRRSVKLFAASKAPAKAIAYTTLAGRMRNALSTAGIVTSKVCHLARGSAARQLDVAG